MAYQHSFEHALLSCIAANALLFSGAHRAMADETDSAARAWHEVSQGELLPTGMRITPAAAHGALFENLNPGLPDNPDYLADHPVATAVGPDGETLLVLTSGYNRVNGPDGRIDEQSNEYVFVYDIGGGVPQQLQAIQVPNTFNGIAWHPSEPEFYVAGGVDDNVHVYGNFGSAWLEAAVIELGHDAGEGLGVAPMAAGLAVNESGTRLLVANFENDSVSLVDLESRVEIAEQDLRPGKIDPGLSGTPGGTYPIAVAFKGDDAAYVSVQRDREIIVLNVGDDTLGVAQRIELRGQPNKVVLNREQSRLYVAVDNSDSVVVIDTASNEILEEFPIVAPPSVLAHREAFKGANPNNLALSKDQGTLFVTNGGTNSVAVVQLSRLARSARAASEDLADAGTADAREETEDADRARHASHSRVIGLLPTGWYPNAVSLSADGEMLYIANGKSNAGPNPNACRDTVSIAPGSLAECNAANEYVWQLEKGGLLTMPVPSPRELARLTWQVAYNANFPAAAAHRSWESTMARVRERIDHVIYVVKENRTYDQLLGDLERGDGDPSLAILGPFSPNHQELARRFVVMDNFYDSGETSNTGWNWTTAARSTDFTEKTSPVNYAGRGLTYDWEGSNRNINVGHADVAERRVSTPNLPLDPDLLAGTADVAAPDSPEGEAGAGYLWDAALRAGLTVRNYGFYGAGARYGLPADDPNFIPLSRAPYAEGSVQFFPAKESLMEVSDPYFRGYDQKYADYWRYKEWEREFDEYAAAGTLPNLSLVRMPHDHFGDFSRAMDGVNTVETQMADNDYVIGLMVEKLAASPFKDNTLIFIIEDDAQNGADHVDPHRSIAYIIGPHVKQGAVVSKHYTTVSMLRTIEEVLGIEPLGINDGLTAPMVDVFDLAQARWEYTALVPEVLYTTDLPLPPAEQALVASSATAVRCDAVPKRSAEYWQRAMAGQDFSVEDNLHTDAFNEALWSGLNAGASFPGVRHGRDLRDGRKSLIRAARAERQSACSMTLATARAPDSNSNSNR